MPKSVDSNSISKADRGGSNYEILHEGEDCTSSSTKTIGYASLLGNCRYLLAAISATFGYFIYGFLDPVLSMRLDEMNLTEFKIVLFFMIKPCIYMISSAMV
jgi:hypothetical protein